MNQLFEKFELACSKSVLRVSSKKTQKRMKVRKKSKSKGNCNESDGENELMEEEEEVEVVEKMAKHLHRKFF